MFYDGDDDQKNTGNPDDISEEVKEEGKREPAEPEQL